MGAMDCTKDVPNVVNGALHWLEVSKPPDLDAVLGLLVGPELAYMLHEPAY